MQQRPCEPAAEAAEREPFLTALTPKVGAAAAAQMWLHWQLVQSEQRQQNLTGIKTAADALARHYLDALAVLPLWVGAEPLLDVGSGAGFPGLVLALARPNVQVTLSEPRRLRADFLQRTVAALSLANVTVVAQRAETLGPRRFGALTMRAVFAGEHKLMALAPVAKVGSRLFIYRQGDLPAAPAAGRWRLAASHPNDAQCAGDARRIDEWIFT